MTEKPSETQPRTEDRPERASISRRDLLRTAGAAGAAALVPGAAIASTPIPAAPIAPPPATPSMASFRPSGPLMNLTAQETEILGAMVDRLIPSDDMGPGAIEAGALRFIDRALSEAESDSVESYRSGLAALDRYARYSRGAPFVELSDLDKDSLLIDVQLGAATGAEVGFEGSSGSFFNMVKSHTWQGTFGDPLYGGNVDFIGWDILGYPGVRMRVTDEDQKQMEAGELPPARRSAYDFGQFQALGGADDLMPTQLRSTDVVVIGLGAAGGVAVQPLAAAGLDVVGLEAGTWLDRRDFAPDEIRNNYRDWPMLVKKAEQERPTSRATSAQTANRIGAHPMMNAVGGTTLHYWAQSWRLNPWDFRVVSETTRRYGAARVPAGSTVQDWPFGYEELEPFYDRVEREVGVSGQAGNVGGRLDERGNKFEGPRQRDYPMPALRWTAFNERMADAARGLGWHPFPGPAAINTEPYQGRSGCGYHGFCNKGGCPLDAKNSPHLTTIPRALETGNLRVVTRAHVTTIEADANGRVTGVNYVVGNQEYFQPARVVLVASYTYENSRLLLLSKSRAYPDGLSNNHGQVGRHYFSHHQGAGVGALLPFDTGAWYGLPAQGVAVDDFADDNWDHSDVDFIGGGNLWAMSDRRPISAANMSTYGLTRNWGSAWKRFIHEHSDRTHSFYIQKTTLPYEDNYLDLDPQYTDPLGFPVIRITGQFKENERAIAAYTQDRAEEWYREIGALEITRGGLGGSMGASTHAYGGTRMGDDPETNVVDRWGFSHEAPNLGVLGASVMGTSGARNPTLTAQALAWRTAERLVEAWSDIAE